MPMKLVPIFLLLFFIPQAHALKCSEYVPPNAEEISLVSDKGAFAFSVPSHLEGKELQMVYLWVYSTTPNQQGEIGVPVAYKIENGNAVGEFAIFRKDVEVVVSAKYTQEMCGPRLERSVNI